MSLLIKLLKQQGTKKNIINWNISGSVCMYRVIIFGKILWVSNLPTLRKQKIRVENPKSNDFVAAAIVVNAFVQSVTVMFLKKYTNDTIGNPHANKYMYFS